jgi:prepilin-type N-terminal cleavage/methylation domain-containing protein
MKKERGFTLLEILLAMIILAVGGVSVISLFAAGVSLQYDSAINQRRALILADVVADAQQTLDAYAPTDKKPLPPDIAKRAAPQFPRDFEVAVTFREVGICPPGEGAEARISLFYKGRELPAVRRVLQRTVFTEKELEGSLSYEEEKSADAQGSKKSTGDSDNTEHK